MTNTQTMKGSCLCGQITYKAKATPLFQAHCHCQACRKNGGSGYAALVFIPIESLTWQGETSTYSHDSDSDSGTKMTKHFCGNCGSQLFGTNSAKPERIHIKVGTMEDASWFQPQCNVWASSRLPSTAVDKAIKDFATMPSAPPKAHQEG